MRYKIIFLIISFFFIGLITRENESSVAGDRQALMDLYEATGGNSWYNNSGWGSGDPSSSWHGIETDANGRVTRVDLYDNGLSGQLPESIGNLSKVKYLNVKKNKLSGEIPPSIGNMGSLEWLILSGRTYDIGAHTKEPPSPDQLDVYLYHPGKYESSTNNFSGSIPSSIGNLSSLMYLELSGSSVNNIPPELGNLSNLRGLYMSYNENFEGLTLPAELGNLTKLKQIIFNEDKLEGELPSSFQNLTKLAVFHFGKSNLTGEFPDFSNFTNLHHLVLSKNNLDGEYPSYWNNGNFTQLITLNLAHNDMTGSLHGFDNLPNLESLTLDANDLSGTIGTQMLEMPERIQIIGLGWNNFTGELPQSGWPDFYKLKTLYLNDNELSGGISCDFWEKIDNPKLGICWLSNNKFESNCTSSMDKVKEKGNQKISVSGNNFLDLKQTKN